MKLDVVSFSACTKIINYLRGMFLRFDLLALWENFLFFWLRGRGRKTGHFNDQKLSRMPTGFRTTTGGKKGSRLTFLWHLTSSSRCKDEILQLSHTPVNEREKDHQRSVGISLKFQLETFRPHLKIHRRKLIWLIDHNWARNFSSVIAQK